MGGLNVVRGEAIEKSIKDGKAGHKKIQVVDVIGEAN